MKVFETFITKPQHLEKHIKDIREAGTPDLFNQKFLEELGFEKPNSILYVSLFKTLGLVDEEEKPVPKYYSLFAKTEGTSRRIVSERVRETYDTVFKEEPKVHSMSADQVHTLFKKLMSSEKSSTIVSLVANTFYALIKYANVGEYGNSGQFSSGMPTAVAEERGNGLAINTRGGLEGEITPHQEFLLELMNGCSDHPYGTSRQPAEAGIYTNGNGHTALIKETQGETGRTHYLQQSLIGRARMLERLERWEEAAVAYDEIIDFAHKAGDVEDECVAGAIYKKADTLERLNKYEEALVAYDRLIQWYH